jgi:hypothetical protein
MSEGQRWLSGSEETRNRLISTRTEEPLVPNRIIRESARTSPTLDALGAEAERLFWRLITVCDDHGRFNADPRVVLATAFPLRVQTLTVELIGEWLQELAGASAIGLYEVGGRQYGYFRAWEKHQRRPQSVSKFPAPQEQHGDATVPAPRANGNAASTVTPPSQHGEATVSETLPREVVNRETRVVNGEASTVNGDGFTQDQMDKTRAWVQSIRRTPSHQREKRTKEAVAELRWLLKVPEEKIHSLMLKIGEEMQ